MQVTMKYHSKFWALLVLLGPGLINQRNLSTGSTFDQDEWTPWSRPTPCSRPCDGGITQQYRRCKSPIGCHGVSVRRRMCNMQTCLEPRDDRGEQCSGFDGIKYRGIPRKWEPFEDPQDPCANTCRAIGTSIIAKLSARVRDGTRCKTGGLHVCVDGTCEAVGCDLKLGSPKKIDECGVCGGDGKTCSSLVYRWVIEPISTCSTPCGGGQETVQIICRSTLTDEAVDELLCNPTRKPHRTWQSCNIQPCEPGWEIGIWSPCSTTCGGSGLRVRRVYCAQQKNSSKIQVAEKLCQHHRKPSNQEPCNTELCPHWHVGLWSTCSASCGQGEKTRNVVCRDAHNLPSSTCDPRLLPPDSRTCEDLPDCPTPPPSTQLPSQTISTETSSLSFTSTQAGGSSHNGPTETLVDVDYFDVEELPREHMLPLIQPYGGLDNGVLYDQSAIPSEPTWVVSDFGPCSETCGQGIRKRTVICKIFLEFTRTVANLPDKECYGPKPPTTESCFSTPCPSRKKDEDNLAHNGALADSDSNSFRKTVGFGLPPGISIQDMSFSWKVDGYTPCSASCLGGVQERRIVCVRDYDQRAATPVLCMDKPRPDIPTTRTCNDHPCPPRWNVTEFGMCSKSCGGGVMTREVSCIHEVTRGNTVTVPNTQCPNPVPRTEMLCNAINCPPYWDPGDWGKCSRPCGGGERIRSLKCKQIIALGQVVERIPVETHCTQPPPQIIRTCNKKPCADPTGKKDWKAKMSLKVKGDAKIYNGVTLKLRCPTTNHMDPRRVAWMKDHHYIKIEGRKLEILTKGTPALRIRNTTFSDSGLYICLYQDRPISNISLMIQPSNRNAEMPQREATAMDQGWLSGSGFNRSKEIPHSTLYADQQPGGVSISPTNARDAGNLFRPNQNLFTNSAASTLKSPISQFINGLLLALWPISKWIHSDRPPNHFFESVRLQKSFDRNSCTTISCTSNYYWKSGEWSNCLLSTCFTWNTGIRTREIKCLSRENKTVGDHEDCEDIMSKPKTSEECFNPDCKGIWTTTSWTECKARCGQIGFMTRVLSCIWYGTNRPAGNACQGLSRPAVIKPCQASPCSKKYGSTYSNSNLNFSGKGRRRRHCRDKNYNCPAIRALNLCHLKQFHGLCCASCPLSEPFLENNDRTSTFSR